MHGPTPIYTIHPGFRALNLSKVTQMCKNWKLRQTPETIRYLGKVTLTRAFTAHKKNQPVIVCFHRVSPIPFLKNVHTILKKH